MDMPILMTVIGILGAIASDFWLWREAGLKNERWKRLRWMPFAQFAFLVACPTKAFIPFSLTLAFGVMALYGLCAMGLFKLIFIPV